MMSNPKGLIKIGACIARPVAVKRTFAYESSGAKFDNSIPTQQFCKHYTSPTSSKSRRSVVSRVGRKIKIGVASIFGTALTTYYLAANGYLDTSPAVAGKDEITTPLENPSSGATLPTQSNTDLALPAKKSSAWTNFTNQFSSFSELTTSFTPEVSWDAISGSLVDLVVPSWAQGIPESIAKLQRELSMEPGSLAETIWEEAHDASINPEIARPARVRISSDLCDGEKVFLKKRQKFVKHALASYLGIREDEIDPEDVPTIALISSGGGLRACVAGAGSYLAATEAGLWDCTTFTAGVSGSCWLQAIYSSSLGGRRFDKTINHLKHRLGIHIAYPPAAFQILNSAPTNKFLLSGLVEKLKGDEEADFGLVDAYGLLLAARLLVPKGELGVNDHDLKISNQREHIRHGEAPLPIYTAVRHEIPTAAESSATTIDIAEQSKASQQEGASEGWFQWFEITPYEFFCEEFSAGIPTWALGRKFNGGHDVASDDTGLRVPELRLPLLLAMFGSAFCATLSHYYEEVKPLISGLVLFGSVDQMVEERSADMKKMHPIEPASVPNFAFGMDGQLSAETPPGIYKTERIQLMDAGMSNNLPLYPLLRPGRDVDVLVVFDASADIRQQNWISVAEGYAKQRGIKGWPIGAGWPKSTDTATKTAAQLDDAQAQNAADADSKIAQAQAEGKADANDLGYCTVWVGTTQERENADATRSKPASEDDNEEWQLMEPDAGIAVVYFPLLMNPKVKDFDPVTTPFMSTWNFIYTPDDVDKVVELAKANFSEGEEKTRRTIRAVYERKKRIRIEKENTERKERFRRQVRLGTVDKIGEGDHFS